MNRSAVQLDERQFREIHLFPFVAAIAEADADSVTNAHHAVDGVPCTADVE